MAGEKPIALSIFKKLLADLVYIYRLDMPKVSGLKFEA